MDNFIDRLENILTEVESLEDTIQAEFGMISQYNKYHQVTKQLSTLINSLGECARLGLELGIAMDKKKEETK
jgi:Mg2+ and Co2+ transporter CorA